MLVRCLLLIPVVLSCGERKAPEGSIAGVPSGGVARVGDDVITTATVERIARAQGVDPAKALDLAIADAVFAKEAVARRHVEVLERQAERAARARALLGELARAEQSRGPPTDQELRERVAARWWDYDRPELRRSVHAVVHLPEGADASEEARARELAEAIRGAVQGKTTAKEFLEAAKAVPKSGFEVRAEGLLPAARDGRAVDLERPPVGTEPHTRYATEFTERLFDLAPGVVSAPFRSPFGVHVAVVLEVIEPKQLSRDALVEALSRDVFDGRAAQAEQALLERLRKATPPAVERSALELTQEMVRRK